MNCFYLLLLGLSIYLANIFSGYNLIFNVISDLGRYNATTTPIVFDITCILGGMIMLPFFLKISHKIAKSNNMISKVVFIFGIIGACGYILLGIFSLERGGPDEMIHRISALFAFGGFILATSTLGYYMIKQRSPKLRYFGYFGMFFPIIMIILWDISLISLFEWLWEKYQKGE